MTYHVAPLDPKGEIQVEELHPRCIEVWFIPEDDRLEAAGFDLKDRHQHRVLLLCISAQDHFISIYPVNTLPNRFNFLQQKYDKIREITLAETDVWDITLTGDLPKTRDDVLEVFSNLPSGFTKDPDFGLGLAKEYRFIIDAVETLSSCTSIVITPKEKTHADEDEGIFYLSRADFDEMRRKLNSIAAASQSAGRSVKETTAHNLLAERIGKPLVQVTAGRSPVRRLITATVMGDEILPEDAQDAAIHALSKTAKALGAQQTERLAKLQSDLELVTLEVLIERFERMLEKKLSEAQWQEFFNANPFILNMAFGYPVIKVRDQASVGGRKLSGDGEKIVDFLVKNSLTNNVAMFEIKKPETQVLNKQPYREGVFTPSAELSGSINQALDQKYQFQKQVAQIRDNTRLYDIESYAVHCCLVVGRAPETEDQKKSFELFRRNSKDVEIVTFDELLAKLKQLYQFLNCAEDGGVS